MVVSKCFMVLALTCRSSFILRGVCVCECGCLVGFLSAAWSNLKWDLSFWTRDWTWPASVKALNPNHYTIRELPWVNFCHGTKWESSFTLLHVAIQLSWHHRLKRLVLPLFSFFLFFFFATPWHMEFPGQGSNHIPKLRFSCGNVRSLTHCARPGIEPTSQGSQDAADPIAPQREFLVLTPIELSLISCQKSVHH